ncbi:hypothetical protein R3W88_011535 [Solanum pinnatisectum]|uniref:Uncharacterized protein n=1 Tax=Solanum pinnatisectum TaxID=50273 RepID=A0AAV9LAA3_9SOLN|nr:hypothetical protein R3W88_011535 [Solanum pinnatisectum]
MPMRPGAPTFVPQETIFRVKSIFVSGDVGRFDLVENFFKSYVKYDALKSSKMTKESNEKALFDAHRCLDGSNLAHEKLDGSMGKLQTTLADNFTVTEGAIYTIEANHTLSNDELERLAKQEGTVETSHQEIISFKLFP